MRTKSLGHRATDGIGVLAFIFTLAYLHPITVMAPAQAAQVVIPGCPGESVQIADQTFQSGDTASCQATSLVYLARVQAFQR